jgi:hypothetical protein
VSKTPKTKEEFLELAMKRLKRCIDKESHNRTASVEDLKFCNGDVWDPKVAQDRKRDGRPVLHFDILDENINQVIGEERMNRVRAKVRPDDLKADPSIAKIRQGIIAGVEYRSSAERIYDYGHEMVLRGGYGAWAVRTRYTDDNPFVQEIYLERLPNPHVVYLSPDAKDECGADAEYGFEISKISEDEYEERYPDASKPGEAMPSVEGIGQEHWWDGNLVTVADYYVRMKEPTPYCQLSDGQVMPLEDGKQEVARYNDETAKLMQQWEVMLSQAPTTPRPEREELSIVAERNLDVYRVKHWQISASEILSPTGKKSKKAKDEEEDKGERATWETGNPVAGKYIPLVLARGPEINIEGKPYVRSFIRKAKDPQRNYDYWNTAAAEAVALAPKAPWLGTAAQFKGYEEDYASANVKNFPFLKYNPDHDDDGRPVPPPQRVQAPSPPMGMFQQVANCKQAVKDALGMHNRDVGEAGPERSGVAIQAVQKPGDVGSYMFPDNLRRAIEHTHRIINDMIPDIYDSERDVPVRTEEDIDTIVPINTTVKRALQLIKENPERYQGMNLKKLQRTARKSGMDAAYNMIGEGRYAVESVKGPSFSTQKTEAANQMLRLSTIDKSIPQIGGDLLIKSMDFMYADELSKRKRKMLPPGLIPPDPDGQPSQPLPPPPQIMVKLAEVEVKKGKLEVEKARVEVQKLKAMKELTDTKGEMRVMLLKLLQEVFASQHPADQLTMGQGGPGPQQGGMQ